MGTGMKGEILHRLRTLLFAVLATAAPALAFADALTVRFHDVVKPDAELQAFVARIKALDPKTAKLHGKAITALFAGRVRTFQRSLDPFQPWNRTADITSDYLQGAADLMVEQGEPEEGKPPVDYRPDALAQIIHQVGGGQPFGRLQELQGAICAPAEYEVDRKAALAFAGKFELDAYSLRFFSDEAMFYARPNLKSDLVAAVPPYTLMMFTYDPKTPKDWGRYETSDGRRGYMEDRGDTLGLAQYHVCFAKVKRDYRIVALFGYGL